MPRLSKQNKKRYCSGCKDNFYNGNNPMGIKECWNLKVAKIITAYRIGWWIPQDKAQNFTKVTTLDCHKETGSFAFYQELPSHLQAEKLLVRGGVNARE